MAWALSAITQAYQGNLDEAERRNNRYKALSPLDPHAFFFDAFFAMIHLLKHEHEAAVQVGRSVTQLNPPFSAAYKPYLAALGHLGRHEEAAAVLQRLLAIEPEFTIGRFLLATPLEVASFRDHYAAGLRLAGVAE
jgi:tetratricopeptide (TPR) repeat protein